MTSYTLIWVAIIAAAMLTFGLKFAGHSLPAHVTDHPRSIRIAALLTVALLSALTAVQTFATGKDIVVDARFPALLIAGIALALRAPFWLVVLLAAAVAAGLRAWGWDA